MRRVLTVDLWDTLIYDRLEVDRSRRIRRLAEMGKTLQATCGFEYEKNRPQMLAAYEDSWEHLETIWQTGQKIVPVEQVKMYLQFLFENKVPENLPEEQLLNAYLEPILVYPPFSCPAPRTPWLN